MLLNNVLKDAINLPGVPVAPVPRLGAFSLDGHCDRLLNKTVKREKLPFNSGV
ncbi:hypothetical protein NG799_02725 [Laspinema sp. D1]|uniref:Uncharacterized protein n=1 Tax=Laspinema palackyanum D2a TaxID=2953684 RepID=A0ABT2MKH3_9CYAN|nr:hypothetical protein [Laspinema sp. D2a]